MFAIVEKVVENLLKRVVEKLVENVDKNLTMCADVKNSADN